MPGILSVDFDYFIDVSSKERDLYFPRISEKIPLTKYKYLWEKRYSKFPMLKKLGVRENYYF